MEISIHTSHVRPNNQLMELIKGRVLKLERFFNQAISATIFVKLENAHKLENKTIEIKLHGSGKDYFVSVRGNRFESALAKGIQALKNQLSKTK